MRGSETLLERIAALAEVSAVVVGGLIRQKQCFFLFLHTLHLLVREYIERCHFISNYKFQLQHFVSLHFLLGNNVLDSCCLKQAIGVKE